MDEGVVFFGVKRFDELVQEMGFACAVSAVEDTTATEVEPVFEFVEVFFLPGGFPVLLGLAKGKRSTAPLRLGLLSDFFSSHSFGFGNGS